MKFPTQDELRARFTRKWTQFEPDVLPLFIAESDFPTAPVINEVLLEYTERECFGYRPAPGTVDLGGAVSEFHASRSAGRGTQRPLRRDLQCPVLGCSQSIRARCNRAAPL